jgi:spermidine synthase
MKGNGKSARGAGPNSWRRWSALIYFLFFLSGLTSLIYEVIWVRKFGFVFGVSTYAVSTVLAAFFSGLAIGSYAAGRIIDRTKLHPLTVYGSMEGLVGVYALLLPVLLAAVEATYPTVYSRIGESFQLFTLYRFVIAFVLLVLPTTLMGATLPVLSKLMVDRESVLGLNVGMLYAINTFGAVAGSAGAGFLLIPALGVPKTTLVAAIGNFVLAACAIGLGRVPAFAAASAPSAAENAVAGGQIGRRERIILALAFSAGLAVLALEVVWTRSLVLILGHTTYAFSTMLTAVLVGIALGSATFARYADRMGNRAALVAVLLFTGGLCAALGPGVINRLPFAFLKLSDWAGGVWGLVIAAQFVVCFMLVFIPTFLSGASFPILIRMYSRGAEQVGRTVADVYAMNTLGGIVGSLFGGFVLIRFFGLQPSLTIAALFLMLVGGPLAMAVAKPWSRPARAAAATGMVALVLVLAFLHPRFEEKLLFAGWGPFGGGYYVNRAVGSTVDVTDRHMQKLLYHKEGVGASVDVLETGLGERIISVNAQPVATTYLYDMRALKMLGHLPVLLHPDPKDVLIIGMGAGVSSGIIATYPSVEHVTVVELSEEVPGGTAEFADWNFDVLHNPKLKVVINDGANYVKATQKHYDIISSDPIHPFISGNGILYSYEHWQNCKKRLKEGGVLAQWLPLYQLSPSDFACVIRTFRDVFPDATMWFSGIDTVLIGTEGSLKVDLKRMGEKMAAPKITGDLLSMGVQKPADILGWYVAGSNELDAMGGDAPENRVEYPVLEFTAPRAITIRGVASTMPALLTAVEQLPEGQVWRELNEMCGRSLDGEALRDAAVGRLAGRWLMRGQLEYSYNNPDQYLQAALQAQMIRPQDIFIRRFLADALWCVGSRQYDDGYSRQAYTSFRESFTNDTGNLDALTSAAYTAMDMGNLDLAQQTLALASPSQREVFQVLVYSGLIALSRSDYARAKEFFTEAEAKDLPEEKRQESPTMHIGLGIVALKDRKTAAAREHFARAIEISTRGLETLNSAVDLCSAHGFTSEARRYAPDLEAAATAAIAADPGRPGLYHYRALAYTVMGEVEKAARDSAAARSLSGWYDFPQATRPVTQEDQPAAGTSPTRPMN